MPRLGEGIAMLQKNVVSCDMKKECQDPVTHIDNNGFIYCQTHGIARKSWKPCRKLTKAELRTLQSGQPLKKY
jgi:uncharacterized protein (DUF2237 family)